MKINIPKKFNWIRMARFVLGILILIDGIVSKEGIVIFFGVLLTMLPAFGVGNCTSGNCEIPTDNVKDPTHSLKQENHDA